MAFGCLPHGASQETMALWWKRNPCHRFERGFSSKGSAVYTAGTRKSITNRRCWRKRFMVCRKSIETNCHRPAGRQSGVLSPDGSAWLDPACGKRLMIPWIFLPIAKVGFPVRAGLPSLVRSLWNATKIFPLTKRESSAHPRNGDDPQAGLRIAGQSVFQPPSCAHGSWHFHLFVLFGPFARD